MHIVSRRKNITQTSYNTQSRFLALTPMRTAGSSLKRGDTDEFTGTILKSVNDPIEGSEISTLSLHNAHA